MSNTPLTTTTLDSIAELFQGNPLDKSEADINRLVIELRRRRNEFLSQEAAAAAKPKSTRAKVGKTTSEDAAKLDKPLGEISLDDLLGESGE